LDGAKEGAKKTGNKGGRKREKSEKSNKGAVRASRRGKLGRVKEKNRCVFVCVNMLLPPLTKSFPHHRKPIKK
jgi:hypothetical protein